MKNAEGAKKRNPSALSILAQSRCFHVNQSLRFYQIPPLSPEEDASAYTKEQIDRGRKNFKIMMSYVKKAHDRSVKLALGTDAREGGKAALSEILLLYEAGFSIEDILQIVTLNGAKAMDPDHLYGSIQVGKKANLVIFEKSPFVDYKNFLSGKIIIKDGEVYSPENLK